MNGRLRDADKATFAVLSLSNSMDERFSTGWS
jgi:hypothetical protein